ncbi:MAG: calcium-binding protein [Cyanobacteria bacterium P01_A01_bin.135]
MVHTWKGTDKGDVKKAHKTYWGTVWETWKMYGDDGNDTLNGGPKTDFLYGQAGGDALYGLGGDDYLEGGFGLDIMYGGTGDDTYIVGDSGDKALEVFGGGYDTVKAYSSYFRLSDHVERLELLGAAKNGYGNAQNNDMFGNTLNNSIYGGGGNDNIYGKSGNDTLYGAAGNDSLYGDVGHDKLYGGTGNDKLVGGTGNDTYYINDNKDTIVEALNEGTDTVYSYLQEYSLASLSNVENLRLSGNAVGGTGNGRNNVIEGNAKDNYLYGKAGSDTLIGGDGDDALVGGVVNNDDIGAEYDKLTGGGGADIFVLGSHSTGGGGVYYRNQGYAHIVILLD